MKERMTILLTSILLSALPGCSYLDFGGNDEKAFELKFFWEQGPQVGEEDPANPGFDRDGNKIPPPEVLATYQFPDVHAGMNVLINPDTRITPVIGVELLEFKVPYARWFNVQLQGGSQVLDVYLGKRFTSIFEITGGVFVGRDFEENDWTWGLGGTLIKF